MPMPNVRGGGGGSPSDEKRQAKKEATRHRDAREQNDEPSRAERAAKSGAEKARRATEQAVETASSKARNTAKSAAESIEADVGVDKSSKSRNKKFVEEVQKTAQMAPPTDHTLETMDQSGAVTEMARTSAFDGRLEAPGGIDYGGDDSVRDVPDSGNSSSPDDNDSSSGESSGSPPNRLEAPGGPDYSGDDSVRQIDEQGPTSGNDSGDGMDSPTGIEDGVSSDPLSGLEDDADRRNDLGASDAVGGLQDRLRNSNPDLYESHDLWSIEYNEADNAVELNIDQQGYRQQQARELEDEIISSSDAGLNEDDVWISEEDGKFVAHYTKSGKRKIATQRIKEKTGAESVEVTTAADGSLQYTPVFGDQPDEIKTPDGDYTLTSGDSGSLDVDSDAFKANYIESEYERTHPGQDVTVDINDDGTATVRPEVSREERRQQIEESVTTKGEFVEGSNLRLRGGLGESDVKVVDENPDRLAAPGAKSSATRKRPEEDLGYKVEYTDEKVREQKRNLQEYVGESANVSINENGTLTVTETEPKKPKKEQFGDIDWSFGLGGPEDEVESALDDASHAISKATSDVANAAFNPKGVAGQSAGEEILRAIGRDDLGRQYEETLRSFGKGTTKGAGALANVPALAKGGMEGAELVGYGANETFEGRGGEFKDKSVERGGAIVDNAVEQATSNPAETTGLLVGSLAGSYGAMSTAAEIGPRAGLLTRMSIQPGEELAGRAGYAATKAARGTRAAERYFPNGEPLLMSEEAAISGGKRVAGAVKSKAARAMELARSGELPATPYQNELYNTFRAGGARGELEFDAATGEARASESTVVGATSEPLGSDTSGILDATTDVGQGTRRAGFETESATETANADVETEVATSVESDTKSEGVSDSLKRIAGETQARSELSQAMQEFGVNVREFAASERGQASLLGGERRGVRPEAEVGGEIQDDRVTPNLYQQAVDRQVKAEYDLLGGGDYEGVRRPFEAETEAETDRGARRRRERAQESEVTTEAETELTGRRRELSLTQPQTPSETQAQREQFSQMLGSGQIDLGLVREFVGTDTASNMRTDMGVDLLSETETDTKTEVDTESASEPFWEREQRNDFPGIEPEQEFEIETETETEFEVEGEPQRPWKSDQRGRRGFSFGDGGGSNGGERGLGAGWFNEFVTAFGTGAGPREVATDFEAGAVELTEQRQTKAQAKGGEGIEAAEAMFSFDGFDVGVIGDGEGNEDGGFL
ncbi:hypothetical protein V5735_03470 (plasmid) [Haladaptatus sp. SPP-AMP-3]|uniref:hypothetical protein n=1 Tax=Haladaptatus sp. SPP-AMP-3 TaxID=3121295 RepID=UPI003C2EE0DA